MQFKGFFFIIDMNPIALRKAKIVYNFGLSECIRVKRNNCVFEGHKQYFLIFLTVKSRYMHSKKKKFSKKKKSFQKKCFLPAYPIFFQAVS